jgi:3-deoxy-D-manno-octulosonate 8-phosphate phosphatase KdsC-like HAD superfamily phosphatase
MYQSYAQVHLADGMVNRGHVRMFASEPKVVYKEGTDEIDGEKSTVLYRDQGCFTTSECHKRVDENGVEYVIQGGLDVEVTFKQLYDKHYIPFTFKEFLGTETVHKAKVITDLPALQTSVEDICCATFRANYSISDIFFLVKDKDGNEVHRSVYRHYYFTDRELNMKEVAGAEALEKLEVKDGYTIEIYAQIGTGERFELYKGALAS